LPAATGRFVHVYVHPEARRPVRVPDEVRVALTRLQ
jgi:acyl-CoA thioester hydrolase